MRILVLAAPLYCLQAVPEVYAELNAATGKAAALTASAAAAPDAHGPTSMAWTPDRITAEVQSALKEVLGRSLEPDEPFMSGM